jgi:hypothetical protein
MKQLLIIFFSLLTTFICKAQFQPDTIPQYDFFIVNSDSTDFRTSERIIYTALKGNDNLQGSNWCNKLKDSTTNMYVCEIPSPVRIMKIKEITPILPYLAQCIADPTTLESNKAIMLTLDIPNEWKDIISKIYYTNRKQLKIID